MKNEVWLGDCLELMKNIPDQSIDMILTDPPYNALKTDNIKWDKSFDVDAMWQSFARIIKPRSAIVIFCNMRFAMSLMDNPIAKTMFRYDLVYEKASAVGVINANYQPLRAHENIFVFSDSAAAHTERTMHYFPDWDYAKPYESKRYAKGNFPYKVKAEEHVTKSPDGKRHPRSVMKFNNGRYDQKDQKGLHPTQKPVDLCGKLVRLYTQPQWLVFDPFAGSGSTSAACLLNDRKYLSIEKDPAFYNVMLSRLASMQDIGIDQKDSVQLELL